MYQMLKLCMFQTTIRAELTISEGAFPERAAPGQGAHLSHGRRESHVSLCPVVPVSFPPTGNHIPFIFVDLMSEVVLF